jgi:hypothetical protein
LCRARIQPAPRPRVRAKSVASAATRKESWIGTSRSLGPMTGGAIDEKGESRQRRSRPEN